MNGNFYEILGTTTDASPGDIRRAYRKRALQTHPDRLPPGASAEDKRAAEEQFRKVNNAYEILMDSKNRKLYDLYGIWPPPEEFPHGQRQEHRSGPRRSQGPFAASDPFDDFFNFPSMSPFGDPFARQFRPRPAFVFRDPFEMFNAMFADMQHMSHGPSPSFPHFSDSFWGNSGPMVNRGPADYRPSLFPSMPMFRHAPDFPVFPDVRAGGPSTPSPHGEGFTFEGTSHGFYGPDSGSSGPTWISEQRMVRSVNGVTQSIWKGTDRNGNEHATYTYPDGRELYTLNGVEQPHPTHPTHPTHHIQDTSSTSQHDSQAVIPPEQEAPKRRWWSRH